MNAIKPSSNSAPFSFNITQLFKATEYGTGEKGIGILQHQDLLPNSTVTVDGDFYGTDPVSYEMVEFKQIKAIALFVVIIDHTPFASIKTMVANRRDDNGVEEQVYVPLSFITAIDTSSATSQKAILKHPSQVKREEHKANKGFSPAFFTPGTRCTVQVGLDDPKEIIVKNLVQNGPDSFVIDTGIPHESEYMKDVTQSYNISHVIQVLEHKPGKVVFGKSYNKSMYESIAYNEVPDMGRANRYIDWDARQMVYNVLPELQIDGSVYDSEKLIDMLFQQGILKRSELSDDGYLGISFTFANKKKLKRAVRRLVNKVKVNARVVQEEQSRAEYEQYCKDEDSRYGD